MQGGRLVQNRLVCISKMFRRTLGLVPDSRRCLRRRIGLASERLTRHVRGRVGLVGKRFERRVRETGFVAGSNRRGEGARRQFRLGSVARRDGDTRAGGDRRKRQIAGVVKQAVVDRGVGRRCPRIPCFSAEIGALGAYAGQSLDRRSRGNRLGGGEVAVLVQFEQAARCVECFMAMSATHEAAAQRELRRLQAEDGFAEGATRRQEHIEPVSRKAVGWTIRLILMAFAARSRQAYPTFVFAPYADVDP